MHFVFFICKIPKIFIKGMFPSCVLIIAFSCDYNITKLNDDSSCAIFDKLFKVSLVFFANFIDVSIKS